MDEEELNRTIDELVAEEKLLAAARVLKKHARNNPQTAPMPPQHQKILKNAEIIE